MRKSGRMLNRSKSGRSWCRKEGYMAAGEMLVHDWEMMVTFYNSLRNTGGRFNNQHIELPLWSRLRTSVA